MIWLCFFLCFGSAFLLAGIESALLSVSRVRARHAASEGDRAAEKLAVLLDHRHHLLRAAMATHHTFSIAAFLALAIICHRHLGSWGIFISVIIAVPLFLIVLELVPKSLWRLFPFRMLRRCTGVLNILMLLAKPWRWLANKTQSHSQTPASLQPRSNDVTTLAENISALKLLPANASALMTNFAMFRNRNARDIAEPLTAMSALPAAYPLASAMQIAMQSQRRHHPVLGEDGTIIGCLDAANLSPDMPRDRVVSQFAQPLPHGHASDSALRCLQALRKSGSPLMLVHDANNQPAGLIWLDSLAGLLLDGVKTHKVTSMPTKTLPSAPHQA
jgi:CBS domain containing-hemolysin-like protein